MAIYEVGNKVRINLNSGEQIRSIQEVWKFQGQEAKVSRRKILAYGINLSRRGTYYELEGVKSKMGVPFSFTVLRISLCLLIKAFQGAGHINYFTIQT